MPDEEAYLDPSGWWLCKLAGNPPPPLRNVQIIIHLTLINRLELPGADSGPEGASHPIKDTAFATLNVLLKATTMEAKKQPLLGNDQTQQ
jgi:hypothetical protein